MRHATGLHPHAPRRLAAGMALALLAACQPATPPAATPVAVPPTAEQPAPANEPTLDPAAPPPGPAAASAPTPPASETQWQCGEQRVTARFDPATQTVTLVHDRGQLVLPQAVSASGARYADTNGNEFWTKGAGGTLTLSGTPGRECTQVEGDPG